MGHGVPHTCHRRENRETSGLTEESAIRSGPSDSLREYRALFVMAQCGHDALHGLRVGFIWIAWEQVPGGASFLSRNRWEVPEVGLADLSLPLDDRLIDEEGRRDVIGMLPCSYTAEGHARPASFLPRRANPFSPCRCRASSRAALLHPLFKESESRRSGSAPTLGS